jgi:hypothetical protein
MNVFGLLPEIAATANQSALYAGGLAMRAAQKKIFMAGLLVIA